MKRGGIKISTFMVSILVMALFVVTFTSFFSEVADKYGVTYDNESSATIETFNQFESIQNTTAEINQTLFQTQSGNLVDLLGGFLGAGFNVLKLAGQSVGAFNSMVQAAGEQVGLPGAVTTIILTIVVLFVLFAIIGVLVGRDI